MEAEGGVARGRWGTAIALTIAVIFLSVFDAVPLVALPLALLMVALPAERRWKWVAAGSFVGFIGVLLPSGSLGMLGRGWALLLGGAFLLATLWRPKWGVLPRAMAAIGGSIAVVLAWVLASGSAAEMDWVVREHFQAVSNLAVGDIAARVPDSAWVQDLSAATGQMAELQWRFFPALLALQSLAALALAWWWLNRLRSDGDRPQGLRPLKEFRFNDQLVWLVIAGLVLTLLPVGEAATRAGLNLLLFMGSLYALRGIGVFAFLSGGAPSWFTIVFGTLAAIFLYPLVLTAAVLVGLGDTWLDVRGRATLAPPA